MNGAVEDLWAARELLADPGRWTQGVYARDERGAKMPPEDVRAVCWCALGALLRPEATWQADFVRGGAFLVQAADELFRSTPSGVNDRLGHAAVLRIYDRAIELAEDRP